MQSVTVVNNGYSGNCGRMVGSNVNFVTKFGSNHVHGNAIYEWNGSSLSANNFFNNRNDTLRPFDNVNQWAASIGGPMNFDQPVNNVSNTGQFGRIIATVSPPTSVLGSGLGGDSSPRQIQLIAKFIF
jgi:hypothetical protein